MSPPLKLLYHKFSDRGFLIGPYGYLHCYLFSNFLHLLASVSGVTFADPHLLPVHLNPCPFGFGTSNLHSPQVGIFSSFRRLSLLAGGMDERGRLLSRIHQFIEYLNCLHSVKGYKLDLPLPGIFYHFASFPNIPSFC